MTSQSTLTRQAPTVSVGEPLLEVRDWTTAFATAAGLVKAVDGVSFSLPAGVAMGLVGESGSGKTVLSRSILGLLSGSKMTRSGSITFDGSEIGDMDRKQRRALWGKDMAMVFQNPLTSLNPVIPIGRQITESLSLHLGMNSKQAKERAIELLNEVGIPEARTRFKEFPHQLSGGMRQRVTIAIALAANPRLLLADEPTTALDVTVQAQILDLLDRSQSERNMAMILVTHDLGVVAGRTDFIAVMYAGRIVEIAPTRSLFSHARMPYTEALMRSIPRMTDPSHKRLFAIPGRPPNLVSPPAGCRFAPRCMYAQAKCMTEDPPMVAGETPEHQYACWFPTGTPEGEQALEKNLRAGVTAAGTPVVAPNGKES